jgi:NAD(P)-dependent dehydrogenase (short-subunit alcohol dehydrogenase family)
VPVNTITPGAFLTDVEKFLPDPEGYNRCVREQQGIKRRGTPDDIGNLFVFLVGQMIAIDGGWAMR